VIRKPNIRFGLSEWSGAIGDLGILLPLSFALVTLCGFSLVRLFLLWGIIYICTGWFFRVPVAVQPLKAMAVITISMGYSTQMLSSTAFFFGILFIILSLTGTIQWLQRFFSNALICGIQLGVGLILFHKAIQIVFNNGFFIYREPAIPLLNVLTMVFLSIIFFIFQSHKKMPIILLFILTSVGLIHSLEASSIILISDTCLFRPNFPNVSYFISGFIYLIIPQFPLTLGNAIFAASDSCHQLWDQQAHRVNPERLGLSIGLSNIFIGFLGGFPICHGAGGMGAHAKFGARTGGSTIIIGSILVAFALIHPVSTFLFFIPIPVLGAMLLLNSCQMIGLIKKAGTKDEFFIAILIGVLSFLTRNLLIALLIGLIFEKTESQCGGFIRLIIRKVKS
jgi:SulP family sulfate permease